MRRLVELFLFREEQYKTTNFHENAPWDFAFGMRTHSRAFYKFASKLASFQSKWMGSVWMWYGNGHCTNTLFYFYNSVCTRWKPAEWVFRSAMYHLAEASDFRNYVVHGEDWRQVAHIWKVQYHRLNRNGRQRHVSAMCTPASRSLI